MSDRFWKILCLILSIACTVSLAWAIYSTIEVAFNNSFNIPNTNSWNFYRVIFGI